MRKVRDFDAELKTLNERAKLLRSRKIQQFGELIEATGADALEPDLLAGALLSIVAEKDKAATATWSEAGARFFRETSRRSSRRAPGGGAAGNMRSVCSRRPPPTARQSLLTAARAF